LASLRFFIDDDLVFDLLPTLMMVREGQATLHVTSIKRTTSGRGNTAFAMNRLRSILVLLFLTVLTVAARETATDIKSDEEVVFYSAFGWQVNAKSWKVEIRGCVFEPEKRRLAVALLREMLKLKHIPMTPAEEAQFAERARQFLVDHERSKTIVIRFGNESVKLSKSTPDGQFRGSMQISNADVYRLGSFGTNGLCLQFEVVMPPKDSRRFGSEIRLIQTNSVIVVSDIDDTIKLTDVTDRRAMLRKTFLEPFGAVPGMAQVFNEWARTWGAEFCYVSGSPWQLYQPLVAFLKTNQFPAGVFQLKNFRFKDKTAMNLFEDPEKYKIRSIEPFMETFQSYRFVLVGDSGERDPEAYAALARKHPDQVIAILIRDVTDEPADCARYEAAFGGLPRSRWFIFENSTELRGMLRVKPAEASR
jgi:hypothetical protein